MVKAIVFNFSNIGKTYQHTLGRRFINRALKDWGKYSNTLIQVVKNHIGYNPTVTSIEVMYYDKETIAIRGNDNLYFYRFDKTKFLQDAIK
jgi:hypothetical protein